MRAHVLRGATVCCVPGCEHPDEPLRHDVPRGHPLKATVDHVFPVAAVREWTEAERLSAWFDPRFLRPAHFACNSARHNRPHTLVEKDQRVGDWGV